MSESFFISKVHRYCFTTCWRSLSLKRAKTKPFGVVQPFEVAAKNIFVLIRFLQTFIYFKGSLETFHSPGAVWNTFSDCVNVVSEAKMYFLLFWSEFYSSNDKITVVVNFSNSRAGNGAFKFEFCDKLPYYQWVWWVFSYIPIAFGLLLNYTRTFCLTVTVYFKNRTN